MKVTIFWVVTPSNFVAERTFSVFRVFSFILKTEAVRCSETSENFCQDTWRLFAEDLWLTDVFGQLHRQPVSRSSLDNRSPLLLSKWRPDRTTGIQDIAFC